MYYYSIDDRSEVERSLDGRGLRASALELAAYATTDTARPSGQVSAGYRIADSAAALTPPNSTSPSPRLWPHDSTINFSLTLPHYVSKLYRYRNS